MVCARGLKTTLLLVFLTRMGSLCSSNCGSDPSMSHVANSGQHVPQSLKPTCHHLPKTPSLCSVTPLTMHWGPAATLPEPRAGIPHTPKFTEWVKMEMWCVCAPILISEAHLIVPLARYFSLRHTWGTCSFVPCCCSNPCAPGGEAGGKGQTVPVTAHKEKQITVNCLN